MRLGDLQARELAGSCRLHADTAWLVTCLPSVVCLPSLALCTAALQYGRCRPESTADNLPTPAAPGCSMQRGPAGVSPGSCCFRAMCRLQFLLGLCWVQTPCQPYCRDRRDLIVHVHSPRTRHQRWAWAAASSRRFCHWGLLGGAACWAAMLKLPLAGGSSCSKLPEPAMDASDGSGCTWTKMNCPGQGNH